MPTAATLSPQQLLGSVPDALRKLNPVTLAKNPVMLIVEAGAALSTVIAVTDPSTFAWAITAWLWVTVVFANMAEAVAEGRGKAQAESLRRTRTDTVAHRVADRTSTAVLTGSPRLIDVAATELALQGWG